MTRDALALVLVLVLAVAACGGDAAKLAPAELQDPTTCMQCHGTHYTQWSGSMHAYASVDPVFVALNKRGQRETGGQLGTFCVQCHAPMAVALGVTTGADFDPAKLTPETNGITCYFCHDVAQVTGTHDNPLVLALDSTMRGGLGHPVDSPAHDSLEDPLMESATNHSEMCGACHDVTTSAIPGHGAGGVDLERTFAEWQTTFFSNADPKQHLSCGGCHMPSSDAVLANAPGLTAPLRPGGLHEHLWPAIDQPVSMFANAGVLASETQSILDQSVGIVGAAEPGEDQPTGGICVVPANGGEITVRMDALSTGHAWPSGAAQDRRAWLEVIGYDARRHIVFASGVVPDGVDPDVIAGSDAQMFTLWDRMFDATGSAGPMMWDVDHEDASHHLKGPTTDPKADHSTTQTYLIGTARAQLDHVTARVLIRPYDLDLLAQLVASGDLGSDVSAAIPTLTIDGATRTWKLATQNPASGCNDDDP